MSRRSLAWLLAIAGFLFFCWAFDWAWFRPLIQRYVDSHAHRRIEFDELHIGLNRDLQPRVMFRGVTISNAAWAAPAPLLQAGELQFVFAWRSLTGEGTIVSRLILRDAAVDLERQADGHRNWRLSNPDDTGPGKVRVLALDAERSSLRFAHAGIALDVTSRIAPWRPADAGPARSPPSSPSPSRPPAITKVIEFHGVRHAHAFEGRAQVSDVLTFFDTGMPFALRGEANAASLRLRVDGTVVDIAEWAALDAEVHLTGSKLADLAVLWSGADALVGTGPIGYELAGRTRSSAGHTAVDDLRLTLGASTLRGQASYTHAANGQPRPRWQAVLQGASVDVAGLLHALPASDEPSNHQGGSAPTARALDWQAFQRNDVDLQLKVESLLLPKIGAAQRLRTHAVLTDGRLAIDPLQMELAGGRLASTLQLRTDAAAPALAGHLSLRNLRLERLFAGRPAAQRVTGRLDVQADVEAQGASFAAWLATASGGAALTLHDATIADRLEAELELSGGAVLRTLLTRDRQVPLRCAALTFALHGGVVSTTHLSAATDRVTVAGSGRFDLKSQQLELLLTPHREQTALLALDRSVRVTGRPGDVHIALVDRVDLPADPACKVKDPAESSARR